MQKNVTSAQPRISAPPHPTHLDDNEIEIE